MRLRVTPLSAPACFRQLLLTLGAAVFAVALPNPATAQDDAASDRRALEAVYDATGGPHWSNRRNWQTDAPLNDWHGVTTNADGRVVELYLAENGLTGLIPPALGNLTALRVLYLGGNDLAGPIPPELARLENLVGMGISRNQLEGSIPAELGRLRNLDWVSLWENDLTGPIPRELGNLSKLELLDLGRNELTGPIPAELGNLARLDTLLLSNNDLTGPIPAELGNLTSLNSLDLSYNWGLSGPLPSGLRDAPLESIGLYVTQSCAPAAWRDWLATIDYLGGPCGLETDATIDVAVFYSPTAREDAGGRAAIEAVIDLMVAETNAAYRASGVRHRVALVARSEVAYQEGHNDLQRLENPSDGHMDEVHAIRDETGADLVHLILGDQGGLCGQAAIGGPFGVTYVFCGGLTFAHELGHNMGLYHDRFQAQANDSGAFSTPAYGYVNPRMFEEDAPGSSRWITIMSYHTRCELDGVLCSTLPRFSNPRQRHRGDPLGVAHGSGGSALTGPADAAAVLNVTGAVVATWRDRPTDAGNRPPVTVETLPDQTLASSGSELTLDVSQAFDDPDGDALTYTASSEAPRVVRAATSGSRVTLTAVGGGTARVRVTATDTGGLSVSQLFSTTVEGEATTDRPAGGHPDLPALQTLFDATNGRGWRNQSNWNTSAPLNQWFGVTTNAAGRVDGLLLDHNGLEGEIPPELGELTELTTLWLYDNRLTGAIPPELGQLGNLVELRIERNELTGAIPPTLGRLAKLQHIVLLGNRLTGAIPRELGRLDQLRWLDLSRNDLSGAIPAELGRLPLGAVSLSHNFGLSGPLPGGWASSTIGELDFFLTQACAPASWQEWLAKITSFGALCDAAPAPIDVAVIYTPAARREAGGTAAIEAEIDHLIATTNEVLATSGARQRVALAGRSEIAYDKSSAGIDLERLADPSDGHLDTAHDLRDQTGADLLHLLVAGNYDVCGIATVPAPYVDPGPFGITLRSCGGLTFAHEIGHNLGLRHDRFQVQVSEGGAFRHPAYGYVNAHAAEASSAPERRWRTLMSYPAQCNQFDTSCIALPRFSNPRQRFNGDLLGVPHGTGGSRLVGPADAAAVIDATGPAVAAWRDRPDGRNRPPVAVGTLPPRSMDISGRLELDMSSAFADPDEDALTYSVSSSAAGVVAARVAGSRVMLTARAAGRATIVVTATDPGRLQATQSFQVRVAGGGTGSFTDDPLRPGRTPVRAIHFLELRTRIDALRRAAGLAPFGWTDPALRARVTPVRLVHLLELRSALAGAYAAAGRAAPRWTDAAPVAGTTPIRAVHLMELRQAVVALE